MCGLLSACGSNYRASGARGSVVGGSQITIKATSEDADRSIRSAIAAELARRGLQVTDTPSPRSLTLSYHDDWKWDIVMYLWSLDLQIAEPVTGKILATGDFSHTGVHHYPNNRSVVREIFAEMDREGVFRH